jgi:hypothetical protein
MIVVDGERRIEMLGGVETGRLDVLRLMFLKGDRDRGE